MMEKLLIQLNHVLAEIVPLVNVFVEMEKLKLENNVILET
jgi:hypothetical protein